jgi:hypothetical protein
MPTKISKLEDSYWAKQAQIRERTLKAKKLLSHKDEILYLWSIPGMRQSIRKGLKTPIKSCGKKLKW